MPEHFIISEDKCAPEQRQLFEGINKALDKLGVSADEFDRRFRVNLMNSCIFASQSAEVATFQGLPDSLQKQMPKRVRQDINQKYDDIDKVITQMGVMDIAFSQVPKTEEQARDLLKTAAYLKPVFTSGLADGLNQELGRFQDIDPNQLDNNEITVFKQFNDRVPDNLKSEPLSYTNLLQTCADGKPIINNKGSYRHWDHGGVRYETQAFCNIIRPALLITMVQFAEKKLAPKELEKNVGEACKDIEFNLIRLAGGNPADAIPIKPLDHVKPLTPKHFIISDSCAPEQRKLFEDINKALDKLSVSADEFDRAFRLKLMQACSLTARSAITGTLKKLPLPFQNELIGAFPDVEMQPKYHDTLEEILTPEGMMAIKFKQDPTTKDEALKLLLSASVLKKAFISDMAHGLNQELGRFQDIDPAKLSPEDKIIFKSFNDEARDDIKAKPSTANFLQTFADGNPISNTEGRHNTWEHTESGTKYKAAAFGYIVKIAALKALEQFAVRKWKNNKLPNKIIEIGEPIEHSLQKLAGGEFSATLDKVPLKHIEPLSADYVTSEKLPAPEQRFFKALDKVQKLTGNSAAGFDYNIRSRLSLILLNSSRRALSKLGAKVNEDHGTDLKVGAVIESTIPGSTLSKTLDKIVVTSAGLANKEEIISSLSSPNADINNIGVRLVQEYSAHFNGLMEQRIEPNSPYYDAEIAQLKNDIEKLFGGSISYTSFDPDKSILGAFRSGKKMLHELSDKPSVHEWKNYTIILPSEQTYLITAIEECARFTAHTEGKKGRELAQLEEALGELKEAYKDTVLTPEARAAKAQEKEKAAQAAIEERKRQKQEEEQQKQEQARLGAIAREEKERQKEAARIAQEAAEKLRQEQAALAIIPFAFGGGFAQSVLDRGSKEELPAKPNDRAIALRLKDLVAREIKPIKNALNKNFSPHAELGHALFIADNCQIMHIADYIATGTRFNANKSGQEDAKAKLQAIFNLNLDDTPIHQVNREGHEQLINALCNSPIVLVAAVGTSEQVQEMHAIEKQLFPEKKNGQTEAQRQTLIERRASIALDTLKQSGIEISDELAHKIAPSYRARETISHDTSVTVTEAVIPAAASAAAITVPILTAETPKEIPVTVTVIHNQTTVTTTSNNASKTLVNDADKAYPKTPAETEKTLREKAFEATRDELLARSWMHAQQAYDSGHTYFKSEIGLKDNGYPITLSFSNEAGGSPLTYSLSNYNHEYASRGIELGLDDAIDLKIAVQSRILNQEGIEPLRTGRKRGHVSVGMDDAMPFFSFDPLKRKTKVSPIGDGVYTLEINAPDRKHSKIIHASIPLGLNDDDGNILEARERERVVMDFIESHGKDEKWVTKKDVIDILKQHVQQEGKSWISRESIPLQGFAEPQIIHIVGGNKPQKITLAPITLTMDAGGPNPSWGAKIEFKTNDDTDDKNQGKHLRSKTLDTRTSSLQLATARILESLQGITTKEGVHTPGLIEMLKQHCAKNPNDRWYKDVNGVDLIGEKPLQHFFDDMRQYDNQVGVMAVERGERDNKYIYILHPMLGTIPDLGGTAKPMPEVLKLRDNENGKKFPIEVVIAVPKSMKDKVSDFVEKVQSSMGDAATERYSSYALAAAEGEEDKRKTPSEWRASTIKNLLEKAVETNLTSILGTEARIVASIKEESNIGAGNGSGGSLHYQVRDHAERSPSRKLEDVLAIGVEPFADRFRRSANTNIIR